MMVAQAFASDGGDGWRPRGVICHGELMPSEIQHDIDVNGAIVLRLHPECFRAWFESA